MRKMTKLLKEERKAANHWARHIGCSGKSKDIKDFEEIESQRIKAYLKLKKDGRTIKKFV